MKNHILDTKIAFLTHLEAKLCQFMHLVGLRGPAGDPPDIPGECKGGFFELET